MKKYFILKHFIYFLLVISLLPIGCTSGSKNKQEIRSITIGSKHFTEQEILGELMAILIEENTDIAVSRKLNLGGTMVCFNALRTGDIDLYAEYSGTGLVNILNLKTMSDPIKVYEKVKKMFKEKYNLIWLEPFGFNNTYTLTIRKEDAKSLNIKKISDLKRVKDKFTPGFDAEFIERPDGYPGLKKHYGFSFTERPKQMDPGLMYKAIAENAVDVIDGFATDGRIPAYDLVILKDDKDFFPPYYAAPLIRGEIISNYPEIKNLLNKLHNVIDDETMQELNYKVDKKGQQPSHVARNFLKSKGMLMVK